MPSIHQETDRIQRIIARIIATNPAGVNLLLIGGFRFRLLDRSQRFSADIDYHWGADLDVKMREILELSRRVVLREVRSQLDYQGSANVRRGPDADSPHARFLDLRFWKAQTSIEVPVEITRIPCSDPPIVRTADGTVHATASDADMIESKLIAVLARVFVEHRDLVDIFLYGEKLRPDSGARLKQKIEQLSLGSSTILRRLRDLDENREFHMVAVQRVIDGQMDPDAAQQMNAGGGGQAVFDFAMGILRRNIPQS
jgi:hypothetical protein